MHVLGGGPTVSELVSFRDVRFAYADAKGWVLDGVSFCVERGEACALVGPNGCGKSTSLRLLVGLDCPASGEVLFAGERIDAQTMADRAFAKRLRQRIGLVFQDPDVQLFCPTVRDEIAFGPSQMGLAVEEVQRRTDDCLDIFGLRELAGRAPWRLSGGEKRRCALACVVSLGPELLCLDEPTNGLDDESREQLVAFLKSFVAVGKTVLVATHDMAFVRGLSARPISVGIHS